MIPPYSYLQPITTRNCNCAEPMPAWATIIVLVVFILAFVALLPMIIEVVIAVIEEYKEIIRKIKYRIKLKKIDEELKKTK